MRTENLTPINQGLTQIKIIKKLSLKEPILYDQDSVIQGFIASLNSLIPATETSYVPGYLYPDNEIDGARVEADGSVILWVQILSGQPSIALRCTRQNLKLSSYEISLLLAIPQTYKEIRDAEHGLFARHSLKFTNRTGLADVLVSYFLDDIDKKACHEHLAILSILQDLSFRYYEDKRCSSGMYVCKDINSFTQAVKSRNYTFTAFPHPLRLEENLFASPASHRYVDGRNSYYVIDQNLKIHGIIRLKNPDTYSLVARLRNKHLGPILNDMPGSPWVAFVGLREEIFAVLTPDLQFKWSKNHWQLRDRSLVFSLLERFSMATDVQELFVGVLFAMSESGMGASILIPESDTHLPDVIGKIDHTVMGDSLRAMLQDSSIRELSDHNALVGILGSDGLTTINKNGQILSCGDIIDISGAALLQNQGGGRSQAGLAASFYGLSIKISQNGPLSFFHKGKLLLQF